MKQVNGKLATRSALCTSWGVACGGFGVRSVRIRYATTDHARAAA